MFNSLFHPSISIVELLIRAIVVYGALLILLRVSGKRELGQFSPIEFVSIMLISNAVQNSMNGGDNSLIGGLLLATILILMSSTIAYLSYRSKKFRRWVEGTPTLVIRHGKILTANLKKERITHDELVTMLRKQGIRHLADVDSAIFESDGRLTVLTAEQLAMTRKSESVPEDSN
ncbi:MAG: DUF421 domain-containing protein [Bdellovibrionales bacterium]|nr:DUF421 domain-containing protein [Oligoflexia bacterium]